jgi:CBS domain-containing protein
LRIRLAFPSYAPMRDLSQLCVRDVMNAEVTTVGRNEKADLADELMSVGRIRHLVVLDEDGSLAGVLSRRDLFRGALATALGFGSHAQSRTFKLLRVKEIMTADPRTVAPDAPLAEAASEMVRHKIGCLPVVEGGALVGILTEGRLTELVAEAGTGDT